VYPPRGARAIVALGRVRGPTRKVGSRPRPALTGSAAVSARTRSACPANRGGSGPPVARRERTVVTPSLHRLAGEADVHPKRSPCRSARPLTPTVGHQLALLFWTLSACGRSAMQAVDGRPSLGPTTPSPSTAPPRRTHPPMLEARGAGVPPPNATRPARGAPDSAPKSLLGSRYCEAALARRVADRLSSSLCSHAA